MLMIIVHRLSVVHQSAQCRLISALLGAFVGLAVPWVKSLYSLSLLDSGSLSFCHCVCFFFALAVHLIASGFDI